DNCGRLVFDSRPAAIYPSPRPPLAFDETVTLSTGCDQPIATVNVLANDSDPDGDLITATLTGTGQNGSFALDSLTGFVIYTPSLGFLGTDSVTYNVCDNTGRCTS